jgi:hypothetical protein
VLKAYMKAQVNGEQLSLQQLAKMFVDFYKDYASSGRKTLNDEQQNQPKPPNKIDIE